MSSVIKENFKGINVQNLGKHGLFKWTKKEWSTVAYEIPRELIRDKMLTQYPDLYEDCIYFLIGTDRKSMTTKVYVGQASINRDGLSVLNRLRQHDEKVTEHYHGIWTYAVAITSSRHEWDDNDLKRLERAAYYLLPCKVRLNMNTPKDGKDNDNLDTNEVMRHVKGFLQSINGDIFQDDTDTDNLEIRQIDTDNQHVEDLQHGMSTIPEIVTPKKVVRAMVDMLPDEVWNSKTKFLDPACKGGEYLREIYDRLMKTESLMAEFNNEIERAIHILNNQLYGIALSDVSRTRTKNSLNGFDKNIHVIEGYRSLIKGRGYITKDGKIYKTLEEKLVEEFGENMKFDIVIGNPPYQESTGGGQNGGVPLYMYFVKLADKLAVDYKSLIIPTRWYTDKSRQASQDVRNIILNEYTSKIVDFEDSSSIFPGVNIRGGVMYFIKDNIKHDECEICNGITGDKFKAVLRKEMFIRNMIANKIYLQMLKDNTEAVSELVYPMNAFGLKRADTGRIYANSHADITVLSSSGIGFIDDLEIKKNRDLINKYKVITGYGITTYDKVITQPQILRPGCVCTLTYTVLGCFDTLNEAEKYCKYLKNKFVRFMIRATLTNSSITKENFDLVPLADSFEYTDDQLYKKSGLTEEEINYIEKTIKTMK